MKRLIVINGRGGSGKDTLCGFAAEGFKVRNVSSITPIKDIASQVGWKGGKEDRDRKFLADLKQLVTEYNDYPNEYLLEQCREFMQSDEELMFVHIREPEQIAHFVETADCKVLTLLVRRSTVKSSFGNAADDNVEEYAYDLIYDNDLPLEETGADFLRFLKENL